MKWQQLVCLFLAFEFCLFSRFYSILFIVVVAMNFVLEFNQIIGANQRHETQSIEFEFAIDTKQRLFCVHRTLRLWPPKTTTKILFRPIEFDSIRFDLI